MCVCVRVRVCVHVGGEGGVFVCFYGSDSLVAYMIGSPK